MKRYLIAATLVLVLTRIGVSQEATTCNVDLGLCKAEAAWGRRVSRFTIPLSAIAGLIPVIGPVTGLVIPDVEITLRETLYGTMMVEACSYPCCQPGRTLRAATDVILSGTAEWSGAPLVRASVTGVLRAADVTDNGVGDTNVSSCAITAPYKVPIKGVTVSLVFFGNVFFPIRGSPEGELVGTARVSCACEGKPNAPPALSLPAEVLVPIEANVQFQFKVKDPDNDPIWIKVGRTPDWLAVAFDPSQGVGTASATRGASPDMVTGVNVLVYDLKPGVRVEGDGPRPGQYFHEVLYSFTVRVIESRPPQVRRETTVVVRHEDLINWRGRVEVVLSADDPDLQEHGHNFGYDYYFAWKNPFLNPPDWACACPKSELSQLLGIDCVAWGLRQPLLSFGCWARSVEEVIKQGTRGTVWTGAFTVGEVKGLVFGLASTGTFTLIVNNQPPKLTVVPSVARVRPGETVSATVTSTDPDGDRIILTKVSGPGTFPKVEGRGAVSGTYSWTVPEDHAHGPSWEIVTFRADDGLGGVGLASLVIWIERP